VANDLHCPFQNDEAIRGMIRRESRVSDRLVVAGDASDSWSFGHWPKHKLLATPVEEFKTTQKVLAMFSECFPWVDILPVNHDARFLKWLASHDVPPEVLDYFELASPGFNNPLVLMVKGLPNVRMVQPRKTGHAEFSFLAQYGDLVVGHPELYSRIPNKAVGGFIHWLKSFAQPNGLVSDFKIALQGHTHMAGMTSCDFGVWGFENGCLCDMAEYTADPKCRTPRPWIKAYSVFTQAGGVTDINESGLVIL